MTDAGACETYLRLMDVCRETLGQLAEDLSGGTGCPLITGLDMTEVSIAPVYSVFGGWSGYVLDVTLA